MCKWFSDILENYKYSSVVQNYYIVVRLCRIIILCIVILVKWCARDSSFELIIIPLWSADLAVLFVVPWSIKECFRHAPWTMEVFLVSPMPKISLWRIWGIRILTPIPIRILVPIPSARLGICILMPIPSVWSSMSRFFTFVAWEVASHVVFSIVCG